MLRFEMILFGKDTGSFSRYYTITVYAYFETIFDEHLDRIVVWTEDGF